MWILLVFDFLNQGTNAAITMLSLIPKTWWDSPTKLSFALFLPLSHFAVPVTQLIFRHHELSE